MGSMECVVSGSDILGEVPIWCARTHRMWWIDVRRPSMQSYDPVSGEHRVYLIPGPICGSWALRESGGMVLALKDGLYAFAPETRSLELLVPLERHNPQNRLNDGKCDRRGRYWVGSMNDAPGAPDGTFYRIDRDLSAHPAFGDIICPNSVAFSPDDGTMYFADTGRDTIWTFDFDLDAGTLSNRRVFADTTVDPGGPDGSAIDAEGFLWNAVYGGSRVVRYAPDGRVDRVLNVPASQVTSCAFGGDNYDTLYITTASQRLTPAARAKEPRAGGLFAADVGVRGLPEPLFAG